MPSLEELDQIRLAFGDDLVNMIAWDDYVPNIFSCWTSSFYHLDNCSIRGIHSNILDGSYGGQESTGNHWGSGDYLRHQVLPIRSFSKANEAVCGIGTIWDPFSQTCIVDESACGWQPDGNGDNLIGVNDLLDLLGVYGDTDYDQDGIWDSADDCVGEYDECGVCNGSGPSIPIIESIEILYDSVYAEPIDEWFVFEVGADTSYSYVCFIEGCTDSSALNFDANAIADNGSCEYPWECGDPLEYQGEEYETVLIGERCWFREPLRVSNFSNGDVIPSMSNFADGFFELNQIFYYQWNVAVDERSVCPSGWQVPSKADYELLPLGGSLVTHPYGSLLHGYVNCCSNSVTNNGPYELSWTRNGYSDDSAWRFTDNSSSSDIGANPKDNGETIRCIKDAE